MVQLVPWPRCLLLGSVLLWTASCASAVSIARVDGGFSTLRSLGKTQLQLNTYVESLKADSFIVWPNFLEVQQDLTDLCNDLDKRFDNGEMKEAAVKGPKSSASPVTYNGPQQRTVIEAIRKTSTCWLDYMYPQTEIEEKLLLYLDVFRMQLGQSLDCNFNFEDTECQYARYSIGGYYRRHSDSHQPSVKGGVAIAPRDTERMISFILYLNRDDWQQGDGGELRIFGHRGAEWAQPVDVAPTPGTLLLFYSRDFDHEVLATNVVRRAVVGWFRVRAEQDVVAQYQ